MDREIQKMAREEAQCIAQIKQAARKGNEQEARVLTKNLIRIRQAKDKMTASKAQMGSCKTQIQTMGANMKMAQTMKNTTAIMGQMNEAVDVKKVQKTAMEMQKAQMEAETAQEMIGDAFDAMDGDGIEEEMDAEIAGVFSELALEDLSGIKAAPSTRIGGTAQAAPANRVTDDDVERLIAQMQAPPS